MAEDVKAVILVIVSILFVFLWTRVAITSVKFEKQMEQMVLGKDYFIEDVEIKKKDTYSSPSGKYSVSTNYFFYYDYEKDGILPREEFRDNELRKAAGVVCGCIICLLALYLFWDRL